MTITDLTYKSGQTYDITVPSITGISDFMIADSEVGAIFRVSFTNDIGEVSLIAYRRVIYQPGSNIVKQVELYNPKIASAIAQEKPPNKTQINASNVGDIFSFPTPEAQGPIGYSIITEISGKKYAQPFDFDIDGPTNYQAYFDVERDETIGYKSKNIYYIGSWPHISTVVAGALLIWGNRKYVATQIGNRLIYSDYIEDISWPLNTVWGPPPTLSDSINIDWTKIIQWRADNKNNWPPRSDKDLRPAILHNIFNFGGYIDWNLTIQTIDNTGGNAGLKTIEFINGGMAFHLNPDTNISIEFYFNSPISIDRILVDVKSDKRINNVNSSGRFAIENIRNPRNEKAKFKSVDLLGIRSVESIIADDGYIAGPISSPFPAASFLTNGVSDRLIFSINNKDVKDDDGNFIESTLELTNWSVKHVNIRPKYRVDYDPLDRNYVGRSLDESPNVILTTQESDEGWVQEVDSTFEMEQLPDLGRDRTKGFYTAESFWGTVNNTFWWCAQDERGNAQWSPQYTVGVSHPFERLWLRTYDAYASGNLYASFNSGLFLDVEDENQFDSFSRGFAFTPEKTFISYINTGDDINGYGISTINLVRSSDRSSSITIEAGDPNPDLIGFEADNLDPDLIFKRSDSDRTNYRVPGGNITISAGDALYGAKGGDIKISPGRSLGQGMEGGNFFITIPPPSSSYYAGITLGDNNPLDLEGDRGHLILELPFISTSGITITPLIYFPNNFPREGQGLIVDSVEFNSTGSKAYLKWDEITGEIVRSAIAPTRTSGEPTWKIWHQETSRYVRKFIRVEHGGMFIPVAVPWCCEPKKEYFLLKPLSIKREHTASIEPRIRPDWQLSIQETESSIKLFTWARYLNFYRLVSIPWTSNLIEGQLTPQAEATKPGNGTFDELESSIDVQITRQSNAPSASTSRPSWDLWILEDVTSISFFTHIKILDEYVPMRIPLGLSVNNAGGIVTEYILNKPRGLLSARPITELGEIIKRSSDMPESSTIFRPHWELYIYDDGKLLRWYTHAYTAARRYVPIALPWVTTYDPITKSLVTQNEIIR